MQAMPWGKLMVLESNAYQLRGKEETWGLGIWAIILYHISYHDWEPWIEDQNGFCIYEVCKHSFTYWGHLYCEKYFVFYFSGKKCHYCSKEGRIMTLTFDCFPLVTNMAVTYLSMAYTQSIRTKDERVVCVCVCSLRSNSGLYKSQTSTLPLR